MKKVARKGNFIVRKHRRNPKTGRIVYASAYGKKLFEIWVKD